MSARPNWYQEELEAVYDSVERTITDCNTVGEVKVALDQIVSKFKDISDLCYKEIGEEDHHFEVELKWKMRIAYLTHMCLLISDWYPEVVTSTDQVIEDALFFVQDNFPTLPSRNTRPIQTNPNQQYK